MKIVEIRKSVMRRIGQLHRYLNLFGRAKRRWIELEARLIAIENSIGTAEEREALSRKRRCLLPDGWPDIIIRNTISSGLRPIATEYLSKGR